MDKGLCIPAPLSPRFNPVSFMKVVTREGVRGPAGNCKGCGKISRSHILEPAQYEEYEIATDSEEEEYRASYEEETGEDEVELRYMLLERPTVMCHGCWVRFKDDQVSALEGAYDEWIANPISASPHIKMFLKRWKYHKFSHETEEHVLSKVADVQNAIKEALLNVQ